MRKGYIFYLIVFFWNVSHAQNVGIGTPTPLSKLSVKGDETAIGTAAEINYHLIRSGKHTATGSNIKVVALPGAIGTLRIVGRSPSGENYTTAEYRILNGGWNYPLQSSVTNLSVITRGSGVNLSAGSLDGGNGTMNVVISATSGSLIFWSFEGVTEQIFTDPKIGDSFQGGIVAYILQSGDPGYVPGVIHGLIAAPADQSTGVIWGEDTAYTTNATAIGTGSSNTGTLVYIYTTIRGITTPYAAKICSDLVLNGYSDWFLPSRDELDKLYLNRSAIGGFTGNNYWSSSAASFYNAYYQNFSNGSLLNATTYTNLFRVRAIRVF